MCNNCFLKNRLASVYVESSLGSVLCVSLYLRAAKIGGVFFHGACIRNVSFHRHTQTKTLTCKVERLINALAINKTGKCARKKTMMTKKAKSNNKRNTN